MDFTQMLLKISFKAFDIAFRRFTETLLTALRRAFIDCTIGSTQAFNVFPTHVPYKPNRTECVRFLNRNWSHNVRAAAGGAPRNKKCIWRFFSPQMQEQGGAVGHHPKESHKRGERKINANVFIASQGLCGHALRAKRFFCALSIGR